MLVNIISISVIVLFAIMGALLKFNKTSRRIISLTSGLFLSFLFLLLSKDRLTGLAWYQGLRSFFGNSLVFDIIATSAFILVGKLIGCLVFKLIYFVIYKSVASINSAASSICGLTFGIINGALLVVTVIGTLSLLHITVEPNIFTSGVNALIAIA